MSGCSFEPLQDRLQQIRRVPAIVIGESKDVALRHRHRHVAVVGKPKFAGMTILLTERMPLQEFLNARLITLVDNDYLKVTIRLPVEV